MRFICNEIWARCCGKFIIRAFGPSPGGAASHRTRIFVGPTFGAHCADRAQWLNPRAGDASSTPRGEIMRAEIQNVVDEIKQSVGLLRRHL